MNEIEGQTLEARCCRAVGPTDCLESPSRALGSASSGMEVGDAGGMEGDKCVNKTPS